MGSRGHSRGGTLSQSRGRGGKSRGRGGNGRQFTGRRLEEKDDALIDESHSREPKSDEQDEAEEEGSEEEQERSASSRPYLALLQSFTESSSQAKRRKLSHQGSEALSKGRDAVPPKAAKPSLEEEGEELDSGLSDAADEIGDVDESDGEAIPDPEDSDDEEGATLDPFEAHFASPDEEVWSSSIKAMQEMKQVTEKRIVQGWRSVVTHPTTAKGLELGSPASLESIKLKQKLREPAGRTIGAFDDLQSLLGPLIFNYHDLFFNGRNLKNADRLRQLVCLHTLNHVLRTRDKVLKNTRKLADNPEAELRFQGFTRPRVLFLLPTKNACLRMANMLRDLYEPDQQENRKRFDEGYGDHGEPIGANKPADFRDLFGGDEDDMFRVGLKFAGKTLKFFAPFYSSDILFASPLGLRTAIGSDEERKKKQDYDFLSSIEVVVVDHADALLMQNWEHVEYVFEHLNLQPREPHGCDYNHVRMWYLDDMGKYFRQTIVLSSFHTPEFAELARTSCHNWAGAARLQPDYPGVIQNIGVKAKQTFSRFESKSLEKDPDARFDYFTAAVLPSLIKRGKDANGTLIFVPSYLDFVRLRNFFATSDSVASLSFGTISEYASVPDASRARAHFLRGRHRVLLYTERAHHFRRFVVKGVRRVILYGLPENPLFYKEIVGEYLAGSEQHMTLEPGQGTVRAMFSRYDAMKLERIVGTSRVGKMIMDRGDTFEFV